MKTNTPSNYVTMKPTTTQIRFLIDAILSGNETIAESAANIIAVYFWKNEVDIPDLMNAASTAVRWNDAQQFLIPAFNSLRPAPAA
jgi:hypothetical protein